MIWLQELYWGEKARAKGKRLVRAAEGGRKTKNDACWLITLSVYPQGQLDLFSSSDLSSRLFDSREIVVLGVAKDKTEGLSLLEIMTADCLAEGNGLGLKAYFALKATTDWRGVKV